MGKIEIRAALLVHDDKVSEVKAFAEKIVDMVRQKEPRTTQYDWYISQDGKTCYVNETFEDSEAVLVHFQNMSPFIPEGMALGEMKLEILGDASDQLKAALSGLEPKYYTPLALL